VSAIGGSFVGHFQIPDRPGATPAFVVSGVSGFDSSKVDETQREQNHFGVLSYLRAAPDFTLQLATFARYSSSTAPVRWATRTARISRTPGGSSPR
jgi:hypothetical protein